MAGRRPPSRNDAETSRYLQCGLSTIRHTRRRLVARAQALRSSITPPSIPSFGPTAGPPLQADPTLAQAFYSGQFPLGGIDVDVAGRSPFELSSAPRHWQRRLHGFAWLRHLEAAQTELARQLAQSLVDEWLQFHGRNEPAHPIVWELDVASERMVSWIVHANFIMEGREEAFGKRFTEALAHQVRHARLRHDHFALTSDHLIGCLAMAFVTHTLAYGPRTRAASLRRLTHILNRQCPAPSARGGLIHVSRRPSVAMEAIPMLAATSSAIRKFGTQIETADLVAMLDDTAEAMAHWASVAQHSGGGLAVFNGAKEESLERVTSVLALGTGDRALLQPIEVCGGYARLSAANTTVICDVGPTPPVGASAHAQAGTLGFEMSSGGERVIVNCGSPEEAHVREKEEWRQAARQTAAHSALALDRRSSSNTAGSQFIRALTGHQIVEPIAEPQCESGTQDDGQIWLNAEHTGYLRSLGIKHRRAIGISADGRKVTGEDALTRSQVAGKRKAPRIASGDTLVEIRFHGAAGCRMRLIDNQSVELQTVGGRTWMFALEDHPDFQVTIAPSLQINHPGGPAAIQQILVSGHLKSDDSDLQLAWSLSL
ncbi:MAG: heparinase II/III family protein [Pseudomonadota bacterium]